MSFLFILLCLVSRALGLRSSKPQSGFHPDALTTGTFSILCIFALTWGLLGIWTIVALINARCPRLPYLLVLPTLLFFAWSNAAYMVLVVLKNILSDGYPPLLIPAFTFLENIFNDWALVLQFLVIISIIRHRETTLRDATMGKLGGHRHILTGLHVTLALLTLAFGTAAEGLGLDTSVQYYNGNIPLRKYVHRLHIAQKLYYIYAAFAALTAFDVVLSAVLLWRAFKDAAIPDKIANLTLLGIAPVYSALSLLLVVFTIIFSPRGIKLSIANLDAVEGANLAASLLMPLCSIVMMILILAMTGREANWTPGNIKTVQQQNWRPESQFGDTPGAVSEAGYFTPLPAQEHGLGMHEQPLPFTQGSYTPPFPSRMTSGSESQAGLVSAPGSYTPTPEQHGTSHVSIHPVVGYAYEAYVPVPHSRPTTSGSDITPRPQFPSSSVSSGFGQNDVIDIQPGRNNARPASQVLSTSGNSYSPRPQSLSSGSEPGRVHFASDEKIRLAYTPGNSRRMSEVVFSPQFPGKNHSAFAYAGGKSRPASEVVSSSRLPSPSLASGLGNDGFFTPQSHFAFPVKEREFVLDSGGADDEKNSPAPAYDAGHL